MRNPPISYDSVTAFNIGNKLFYQGSGNIGDWYQCDCSTSTSSGCAVGSGYEGWLLADDDNGDIFDGTPHMSALAAAFERHNVGCPDLGNANSGCSGGPTLAPSLTVTQGSYSVSLTWTAVTGASKYWVFRTEGHTGCNLGRALIKETTSTSYTDTEVADGRLYFYSVMAVGSSNTCFGMSSECKKPDVLAANDYQTGPGQIISGSYVDTRTSNDVREALRETLQEPTVYRLVHTWKFDNLPAGGQQPRLGFEGYRPAGTGVDNYQFYYCSPMENPDCPSSDASFTAISGAVINSQFEPIGLEVAFGSAGLSGTVYIRVQDTITGSDTTRNTVYVDYLVIRARE